MFLLPEGLMRTGKIQVTQPSVTRRSHPGWAGRAERGPCRGSAWGPRSPRSSAEADSSQGISKTSRELVSTS